MRPGDGDSILAEHVTDLHPAQQLTEDAQVAAQSGEPPAAVTAGKLPSELVAISGPFTDQRFSLVEGENSIGRQGCTISLPNDNQASRRHCVITLSADNAVLVDPGSTNGTRVNGVGCQPGMPQNIRTGDVVSVGSSDFRLE